MAKATTRQTRLTLDLCGVAAVILGFAIAVGVWLDQHYPWWAAVAVSLLGLLVANIGGHILAWGRNNESPRPSREAGTGQKDGEAWE